MKEIARTKRLEVSYYYLIGYTYAEIEKETGVNPTTRWNVIVEH